MVADLAELRAFMVTAAHPAAIIPSLGPQELQDGIFHRRCAQYKRRNGASLMAGIVAKPLILLTNDDGIYAQGIPAAWQEVRKIRHVEVVAPDGGRRAG